MHTVHRDIKSTRGIAADRGRSLARFLIVGFVWQKIPNMRCYILFSLQLSRMVCKCIPYALYKVVKIDKNVEENGGDACCCYFAD